MGERTIATLPERKVRIRDNKDLNAKNLENMIQLYDNNFRQLDERRISQVTALDDSAVLADVITKLNELLGLLNASDLTEENT